MYVRTYVYTYVHNMYVDSNIMNYLRTIYLPVGVAMTHNSCTYVCTYVHPYHVNSDVHHPQLSGL